MSSARMPRTFTDQKVEGKGVVHSLSCSHHLGWPVFLEHGRLPGPGPLSPSQASLIPHQPALGRLLRPCLGLPTGQQRHLHWLLASLKGLSSSSQLLNPRKSSGRASP